MVNIKCAVCGTDKEIPKKEVNRQRRQGRSHFFCGRSCAAVAGNAARKSQPVTKTCPWCGELFASTTKTKAASYCSRSCASKASVTDKRRDRAREMGLRNLAHTVEHTAKTLRSREGWKYVRLATLLVGKGVPHQFEYPLKTWVFDLALFEDKILVEFDGPYHEDQRQRDVDGQKTNAAINMGWKVVRVKTAVGIIDPSVLRSLI